MQGDTIAARPPARIPSWVPEAAQRYLAHTEGGQSIRALARTGGCHASTVLRQIRRVENLRDDLLVDEALRGLGRRVVTPGRRGGDHEELPAMKMTSLKEADVDMLPDTETLRGEAARILRLLDRPGAVMAVAADMEKAVVVRDNGEDTPQRLGVLDRSVAQAMALKDWISCAEPGRVSRYAITSRGRTELQRLDGLGGNGGAAAGGFAEAPTGFRGAGAIHADELADDDAARRIRYGQTDTPIAMLARRRDRNGAPFLDDTLVRAGERLTEDFELAQMGERTTQNWDRFLTAGTTGGAGGGTPLRGIDAARARVSGALQELGPGLGDVALRCCCYQEGLETAERRMGWSARSGKIVLRIALQRLKRHYESLGDAGGMIG